MGIGTRGQAKVFGPLSSKDKAHGLLAAKFRQKTGNDVSSVAAGTFVKKAGKYDLVLTTREVSSIHNSTDVAVALNSRLNDDPEESAKEWLESLEKFADPLREVPDEAAVA